MNRLFVMLAVAGCLQAGAADFDYLVDKATAEIGEEMMLQARRIIEDPAQPKVNPELVYGALRRLDDLTGGGTFSLEDLQGKRRAIKDFLGRRYPEKETLIDSLFGKHFLTRIDGLKEEVACFQDDMSEGHAVYLKKYPDGRFVTAARDQLSEEDEDEPDEYVEPYSDKVVKRILKRAVLFIRWTVVFILLLLASLFCYRHRDYFKSLFKRLMNNMNNEESEQGSAPARMDGPDRLVSGEPAGSEASVKPEEPTKQVDPQKPEAPQKPEEPVQSDEQEKSEPTKKAEGVGKAGSEGRKTACDAGDWIVVGASVRGNGHQEMGLPCQDSHAYEYLGHGWGIAVTSDGAGSAPQSHTGAAATVARVLFHFKRLLEQRGWMKLEGLPSDNDWLKDSYLMLDAVRRDLEALAEKLHCNPKDLNATVIVVIHSPFGLLTVHVGDGRAGYKDMKGEWHALMTPHKGEEANQTIFLASDFWSIPFYEMSGVTVPESRVIREKVSAFTLMSDGCESTSWLCNQFNEETGRYYDPNQPHGRFFDPLIETLVSFRKEGVPQEEREEKWYSFISSGNASFVREPDDKTMILATLYE